MAQFKTPGVYIVEKDAFPNSVVEVPTAVPVFIGHTEKALNGNKSLLKVPTKITSFLEYEKYFGAGPDFKFKIEEIPATSTSVTPDLRFNGKSYSIEEDGTDYLLYNSIRLFFANGGGPSYIVSVGDYETPFDQKNFLNVLPLLEKEDEPTMVVIPEAIQLEESACYTLQNAVLDHCAKLQSRVGILDIYNGYASRTDEFAGDVVTKFRDGVTTSLNYGTAYYPWVNTSVVQDSEISFKNISNPDALKAILEAEIDLNYDATKDGAKIAEAKKFTAKLVSPTTADATAISTKADADAAAAKAASDADPTDAAKKAASDKAAAAAAAAKATLADATAYDTAAAAADTAKKASEAAPDDAAKKAAADKAAQDAKAAHDKAFPPLDEVAVLILNQNLSALGTVWKSVIKTIKEKVNLMPPSSALAGVYTKVDNTRGVWKAPANVGLVSVISPAVNISHYEQEDLNIAMNGKSVNAIRSFVGEGVLVWGARTLDGNSQDWRYVNVRRTLIMIEQSIKNAAKAYVFEPNDANTWVSIRSMLSNFLTNKWKEGALVGAKPDDAFQVLVGLGTTMTANDILDGYLNITVLLAVSRPAEFIVITFQQQQQKS